MSESREETGDRGVGDALRDAVERTLQATAGSAQGTRERAGELVDELTRRGREARGEITRRGQEAREEIARRGQVAGADLAKRGQEAGAELGRRLETLEQRLAELEDVLREGTGTAAGAAKADQDEAAARGDESKPKAEG